LQIYSISVQKTTTGCLATPNGWATIPGAA
jgi:hypothetical protein